MKSKQQNDNANCKCKCDCYFAIYGLIYELMKERHNLRT